MPAMKTTSHTVCPHFQPLALDGLAKMILPLAQTRMKVSGLCPLFALLASCLRSPRSEMGMDDLSATLGASMIVADSHTVGKRVHSESVSWYVDDGDHHIPEKLLLLMQLACPKQIDMRKASISRPPCGRVRTRRAKRWGAHHDGPPRVVQVDGKAASMGKRLFTGVAERTGFTAKNSKASNSKRPCFDLRGYSISVGTGKELRDTGSSHRHSIFRLDVALELRLRS